MHQKDTTVDKTKKKGRLKWSEHVTRMNERRLPSRAKHGHVEGIRSKETKQKRQKRWIGMRRAIGMARGRKRRRNLVSTQSSLNG